MADWRSVRYHRVGTVNRPYPRHRSEPGQAVPASGAGSADASGTGWHSQDADTWHLQRRQTARGREAGDRRPRVRVDPTRSTTAEVTAGAPRAESAADQRELRGRRRRPTPTASRTGWRSPSRAPAGAGRAALPLLRRQPASGWQRRDRHRAAGITIASSSLGWFGDARGDGTGPAGSVAARRGQGPQGRHPVGQLRRQRGARALGRHAGRRQQGRLPRPRQRQREHLPVREQLLSTSARSATRVPTSAGLHASSGTSGRRPRTG